MDGSIRTTVEEYFIDLSGEWKLRLNGKEAGPIFLPSTVTESGYGEVNDVKERLFLSERHKFEGKAVYTRTFEVHGTKGKRFLFSMERSRVTYTCVNGKPAGMRNLLTSSQILNITDLVREGENEIAVTVDNTLEGAPRIPILGSHMATEHTQTNWNGIVGKIGITIEPEIYPELIRVYPNAADRKAEIRVRLFSGRKEETAVQIMAGQPQYGLPVLAQGTVKTLSGTTEMRLTVWLSDETPLWSEFDPQMTSLKVTLVTGGTELKRTVSFGLRDFAVGADHHHFAVNGKNIFVRSEANCAVFPLTGYAPMDEASWDKLFDVYRAYGINYVRCHSWCPPDAAFRSADKKGLYIQPELCEWTFHTFEEDAEYAYYSNEARTIIDQYGNHPSLVAMTWGNELRSDNRARMGEFVKICHEYDPTRLYSEASNPWYGLAGINPDSEFILAQSNYEEAWRGAFAGNKGFINEEPPAADHNYSESISKIDRPVVSFEVGQFQVYPDYREIGKYTGVLEARNLESYREDLEAKGLKGRDHEFCMASGKLAMQCYREEIEAAMRTPEMAGISLLGLQDFSGQGTALVGMIDAFGDPKDFAEPAEFRRFFSPVTPLLVFDKKTMKSGEKEVFTVLVHNFGPEDLESSVSVQIKGAEGKTIYENAWRPDHIPQGKLSTIAGFELLIPDMETPQTLTATVRIGEHSNEYEFYVYPAVTLTEKEQDCFVRELDETARKRLKAGESLILLPENGIRALPLSYPASYISDFWCWYMFRKCDISGTMGLSLNPDSAIFREFPTADHTDERWWYLLHNSRAAVLTDTGIVPIIQMIDNLQRNNTLALAYGVRVGAGKLMVCTLNLSEQKEPSVAAFTKAIASYALSSEFAPEKAVTMKELHKLVPGSRTEIAADETRVSAGYHAASAGNILKSDQTVWETAGLSDKKDAWIEFRFAEKKTIDTVRLTFSENGAYETNGVEYDLPGKMDSEYEEGGVWKPVMVDFRTHISCTDHNILHFEPVTTDALRIIFKDSDFAEVNCTADEAEEKPFAVVKASIYGLSNADI